MEFFLVEKKERIEFINKSFHIPEMFIFRATLVQELPDP